MEYILATLKSVENRGQTLILHFDSPEKPEIDFVASLSMKNHPYPSKELRDFAKAINGGSLILVGGIIWKGTESEIFAFFSDRIGKFCEIQVTPFSPEYWTITNVRAVK